jgi:5-methylcytosine-specific restriction endonuclease McrA
VLVCDAPIKRGPRKGQPAKGEPAGYHRHIRAGEPACEPCRIAMLQSVRQWKAANPDKERESIRRWQAANRDKVLKATRKWHANNPERLRDYNQLRRARKSSASGVPFTSDQLSARLSMFPGCWMCGADADTVDHVIPLALGGWHCLSNLRPACNSCNASKGIKSWRDVA